MDASHARQRLRHLQAELADLLAVWADRAPVLDASLYEQQFRCGKPNCKCAAGDYRHTLWCLSYTEDGHSRTRAVPASIRAAVEALTAGHRRLRAGRRRLQELGRELLGSADALAADRRRRGRERYARLAAAARAARGRHGGKEPGKAPARRRS